MAEINGYLLTGEEAMACVELIKKMRESKMENKEIGSFAKETFYLIRRIQEKIPFTYEQKKYFYAELLKQIGNTLITDVWLDMVDGEFAREEYEEGLR